MHVEVMANESTTARLSKVGPIYMSPPSTPAIRNAIRNGELGMIATPAQGNVVEYGFPYWCADNGVFGNTYPGNRAYLSWLRKMRPHADRCLFVVSPDVVGDHFGTWVRSRSMIHYIRDLGFSVAFVAQNGMEYDCSEVMWHAFDCLFIGGDTEWKLGPAARELAATAMQFNKWVHMGRVNSLERYRYATEIGCDSVDGTLLTHGPDKHLERLLNWKGGGVPRKTGSNSVAAES